MDLSSIWRILILSSASSALSCSAWSQPVKNKNPIAQRKGDWEVMLLLVLVLVLVVQLPLLALLMLLLALLMLLLALLMLLVVVVVVLLLELLLVQARRARPAYR